MACRRLRGSQRCWQEKFMLRPTAPGLMVYLHPAPTDMRAGRNGLAAIAREAMQEDPFGKTCFVFTNKRYTALKILAWDINGSVCGARSSRAGRSSPGRACILRVRVTPSQLRTRDSQPERR